MQTDEKGTDVSEDEALAVLRRAYQYEFKGVGGVIYTWHLPDLMECLTKAGEVPLPLLRRTIAKEVVGEDAEVTPEQSVQLMQATVDYRRALVVAAVDMIDGVPVTLTDEHLELMHPEDVMALAARAEREVDPDGGRDDGGP